MGQFDFQNITIGGRVVADPEFKVVGSGRELLSFRVATTKSWRSKGSSEWQEKKLFLACVMWGPGAKHFSEKLAKGQEVVVFGELEEQTWEKDGQKRSRMQLVVQAIKRPSAPKGQSAPAAQNATGFDDDDVPF